jgi:hypothetical protein
MILIGKIEKNVKVYLEFLNWVFIRRKIPPSSINMPCSAVSKFICAFITDFNFAQTKFRGKKQKLILREYLGKKKIPFNDLECLSNKMDNSVYLH